MKRTLPMMLVVALLASCEGAGAISNLVSQGTWGGLNAKAEVGRIATFTFQCLGRAVYDQYLAVDADSGSFNVLARLEGSVTATRVRLRGTVFDRAMLLRVETDAAPSVQLGVFQLTLGVEPTFEPCRP